MSGVPRTPNIKERSEDGFTLIELLVVVVIIGILIAIAIPLYLNYQNGARNRAAQSDLHSVVYGMEQCKVEYGTYGAAGTQPHPSTWNPCVGQTIALSNGTHIEMTIRALGASWTATSSNGGSGKTYSYDSLLGGSIN